MGREFILREECVKVEDLREDDRVDLESCPYLKEHPSAPFHYAIVTKVVQQTSTCVAVTYKGIDQVDYPKGMMLRRIRDCREVTGESLN